MPRVGPSSPGLYVFAQAIVHLSNLKSFPRLSPSLPLSRSLLSILATKVQCCRTVMRL